jgi:two-component sensor histidine kinase
MVALRTGENVENVIMGVVNRRDKSRRWIKINAVPLFDGKDEKPAYGFATFDDITELKAGESQLNAIIEEKDILLRELHHRVKNNLQKIVSIIYLQVSKENDDHVVDILKSIQSRIYSMSLVHERLYRSSELAHLSIRDYLQSLAEEVIQTFQRISRVRLETRVEDISLGIDNSLALGLIINELVSNSMKYAFDGRRDGMIRLDLQRHEDKKVRLIVADNGGGSRKDSIPSQRSLSA